MCRDWLQINRPATFAAIKEETYRKFPLSKTGKVSSTDKALLKAIK
jgi:hypothetical protein